MSLFSSATGYRGAVAALALACATPAFADVVTIDVTTVNSIDFFGDGDNVVLSVDLNAALGTFAEVTVDGIGWDVTLDTFGDSWLSEARVSLQDSAGNAYLELVPGIADTQSGSGSYSSGGIVDLAGAGLGFTLADGILVLEFFESFDNMAGLSDAVWGGSLQISATGIVPLPGAVWFLASALGVLFARGRAAR